MGITDMTRLTANWLRPQAAALTQLKLSDQCKVRHWLREAFRLEVQRQRQPHLFLPTTTICVSQSEKLIANVKKMQRQFDTVLSCVNSIEQSGGSAILPPDADAVYQTHTVR